MSIKSRWKVTILAVLAPLVAVGPPVRAAHDQRKVSAGVSVAVQGASATDEELALPHPPSVARQWNEQLLAAIRIDIPKPPVHARNLFHLSVAVWDAWAAYAPRAVGYLVTEKQRSGHIKRDRNEAISYAAYRLLKYRFPAGTFTDIDGKPCHPFAATSQTAFDAQMDALGYDKTFTSTVGDSPAALGNRIAEAVIAYGQIDGSNEGAGLCYPDDTGYASVNPELIFKLPGVGTLVDPNRWQPLAFDFQRTQNGIPIGKSIQRFIGVGWGDVRPFALTQADINPATGLPLDPGPQPKLGQIGDAILKDAIVELIRRSSCVDTSQDVTLDVGPGAISNNSLGTDDGTGHPKNPFTKQPYRPNLVDRADFQRVVAEFWADGPHSETPPGHWNVLANFASDRLKPAKKRIGHKGAAVNDLEWDVKLYLALNGAVHDAAIWAWGAKAYYDSARPITLIRYMAGLGQSSDPSAGSYNPDGLPLVPDLIEIITLETSAPGGRHAHLVVPYVDGGEGGAQVGDIAIRAWLGGPSAPVTQVSGVGWRRGVLWIPYMPKNFVTPPFPGYTSGHSTFSRAGAEVLAAFTGSPFFPDGLGTFTATQNTFLANEPGPSQTVELQWATYFDAADQAGISRRFGGIHPYYDDYPSRIFGSQIGQKAWAKAQEFYRRPR